MREKSQKPFFKKIVKNTRKSKKKQGIRKMRIM